ARPGLPERRERAQDQAPVPRVQRLPAEAARREAPRRLGLEDDVGRRRQCEEQLAPARPVEREGDPALRRVEREPEERTVGIGGAAPEGRPPARRIAVRRLDLHHVRAEIAEDLAGEEAGLRREVEDADAGEGVAQRAPTLPARRAGCQAWPAPAVVGLPPEAASTLRPAP